MCGGVDVTVAGRVRSIHIVAETCKHFVAILIAARVGVTLDEDFRKVLAKQLLVYVVYLSLVAAARMCE